MISRTNKLFLDVGQVCMHCRMAKLLEMLPLNLAGFRRGASPRTPGACVTVMGLRLPEDLKPTVDNQQQAQVTYSAHAPIQVICSIPCNHSPSLAMQGSHCEHVSSCQTLQASD